MRSFRRDRYEYTHTQTTPNHHHDDDHRHITTPTTNAPPPPPRPDGRILAIRARLRFQRQDWKGALRLLKVLLDR